MKPAVVEIFMETSRKDPIENYFLIIVVEENRGIKYRVELTFLLLDKYMYRK